jgi:hypothetical protein
MAASVLVVAASLAAFNAWQLSAPAREGAGPGAGPEREAAAKSGVSPQPEGWSPAPPRQANEGPLPDGLMRAGDASIEANPSDAPARDTRHPVGAPADTGRTLELPSVSAILWNETRPLAVIDGDVVAEGETVGTLKVERIDKRAVRCSGPEAGGRTIVLRLSQRGRGRTP